MEKLLTDKVFVLHVKSGYEDREFSISKQFAQHHIDFEYMLDGDMADISSDQLEKFFIGDMKKISPFTSCALKHLLVYEQIIQQKLKGALIFEDDILLYENFNDIFNKTMIELENRDDIAQDLVLISYEDSILEYVPKKSIKEDTVLYQAEKGRCAGAYYISLQTAQIIIDFILENKCGLPIDWFHNEIIKKTVIKLYWCQPPIAMQGSHSGIFKSSLDGKSHGLFHRVIFGIRKFLRQRK